MVGIMLTEVTEQSFDDEVLNSGLPVFICFTTSWCHSCYPTCLFADKLAKEYDGRVKFVNIDIEESPGIAKKYNVIAVPTILLFQEGQVVKKLLGFQERRSLRSWLDGGIAD